MATTKPWKDVVKRHFTASRIAYMAIFTALAFVVTFLEFPVFPAVPAAGFLKLDFANLFFIIEGFIFGPVEAVVSIGIKELLCWTKSSTGGVGELANFLMSTAYILVPSVGYRYLKGKKWVVVLLSIACVVQIGISMLVNRFINFPVFGELFLHVDGAELFREIWYYVLLFNVIKSVVISVVVFFIYKPLSKFINMTSAKFEKQLHHRRKSEAAETDETKQPSPETETQIPTEAQSDEQAVETSET